MVFSTKNSEEIMHGGKIIMPSSALGNLARLNITYPMLFKLTNRKKERQTHCGVLEFVAEEGRIYVPHWVNERLIGEQDWQPFWWEKEGEKTQKWSHLPLTNVPLLL